jgi:hypothetical protein
MAAYKIEIEIYEGKGGTLPVGGPKISEAELIREGICAWMHRGDGERSYQQGDIFTYPEDRDKVCPWLLDSLRGVIEELAVGKTLGWRYAGTPYEKVIDKNSVTTEFVRCIDPTASGIVVKVIRTRI